MTIIFEQILVNHENAFLYLNCSFIFLFKIPMKTFVKSKINMVASPFLFFIFYLTKHNSSDSSFSLPPN